MKIAFLFLQKSTSKYASLVIPDDAIGQVAGGRHPDIALWEQEPRGFHTHGDVAARPTVDRPAGGGTKGRVRRRLSLKIGLGVAAARD